MNGLEQTLINGIGHYKLLAIYLTMVLESTCIPIPSEVVMPYSGYLAATGKLSMFSITLVAALANLSGSWLAYAVGKYGGRLFIEKYGRFFFVAKKHLAKAELWFDKKGEITVFISRMLPGIRSFISLPAGIAEMNFAKFSIYSFLGALPWNFALAYLGYVFTNRWNDLQYFLHQTNLIILAGLVLVIVFYLIWLKKGKTKNEIN